MAALIVEYDMLRGDRYALIEPARPVRTDEHDDYRPRGCHMSDLTSSGHPGQVIPSWYFLMVFGGYS